ncbi:putative Ig domain-containing protein [Streptomyces sp. N35]|uniref:putative Ig domain-containing protein n=1 Tax=Streptomyces sp. N35 TaxID=2795730 RepID=UPI0018F576DC|nr:putative Ig domain-containing protein [Streptomyces sp. N35]
MTHPRGHRRTHRPRSGVTWGAAAAGVLLTLGALQHSAQADPAPPSPDTALVEAVQRDLGLTRQEAAERLADEAAAQRTATALRGELGDRLAGVWFDAGSGTLAAAVTSGAGAGEGRAAGARPPGGAPSGPELAAVADEITRLVGNGKDGVRSWGVDVRDNRVRVAVAEQADPGFLKALKVFGDRVHVETGADTPRQQGGEVAGGEKWVPGSESPCSIGFSVTRAGGAKAFVTAGHCTNDVNQAAYGKDGTRVGTSNKGGTGSYNNREGDFGIVDVDQSAWTLSSRVEGYSQSDVTLTGSQDATVGTLVCRSGQTSQYRCGEVTQVNQSVDYGNVVIDGLSYTDACSAGGDSGGSYVTASGGKAVGIHSGGGSNTCGSSGETFTIFQPVNEALSKFSATLVTGAPQPGEVTVAAVSDQHTAVGQRAEVANSAEGGTAPYTWSAGGLPAGFAIDASSGTISGAASTEGTSNVTVTATDSAGRTGSTRFTWRVGDNGGGTLSLQNPGSQTAYIGKAVDLRLVASGGSGARTFAAVGLPAGVSIDRASGRITGSPTKWGSTTSRITVTDGAGKTASTDVSWFIFY